MRQWERAQLINRIYYTITLAQPSVEINALATLERLIRRGKVEADKKYDLRNVGTAAPQ